MKVLLINIPLREQYPPQAFAIGLAYVAKYLLKAGHDVKVLDIDINRYDRKRVVEELKKYQCDVIGTGGLVTAYKYLKWFVPVLRKIHPHAKIIIGGSLPTSAPEQTLKGLKPDFIVMGEGEIIGPNLVNYLDKHKKLDVNELKEIKGIGFMHKGKIILTPPEELIQNLSDLEFPAWGLFPMDKILKYLDGHMSIMAGRSCPFRCKFCYHVFGYTPRRRSMKSVVKEMKFLTEHYRACYFDFIDDLFVYTKKDVLDFIHELRKNKLKVEFSAGLRAGLVTDELIKLLMEAGCKVTGFGAESGSQKVLNLMNKDTKVEQMDNAIRIFNKNKITWFATTIIGYPGETEEDIDQTIAFCKRNGLLAKPFFATPYPGTPLFSEIRYKVKDMDKFLESLGDARDLVINISNFSNEELIRQRRRVIEETERAYLKKHRFLALLFSPLRLLNIEVGFVVYRFLHTPFRTFLKISFTTALSYVKGKRIVPLTDVGYDKTDVF